MSTENLRLRFFAASRRSATMAADRACAPPRTAADRSTSKGCSCASPGWRATCRSSPKPTNPVLATPGEVTVLDARVRLLPRRPKDPCLRRLR
ncbi:hypothetical protein [Streptomyces sp. NPDC005760]|uniref:hypothetical protein n=1 Tax=Streptomyces sp. NPDC005760 TaxID=3156718 RepID=UPI00340F6566